MYIPALGIYHVYTWYIPCIIFIGVPDACNLSRSKTQRQSRRLKYALNKASWLRISDWPHNQVSMSIEPSSIDAS